jgi:hypothetical protein
VTFTYRLFEPACELVGVNVKVLVMAPEIGVPFRYHWYE